MRPIHHLSICILICLSPTILAGQALQVQSLLPENHSPTDRLLSNSIQLTDPPLLRISNIGSSGQDGVSIELIPLSLMSTGPMLLLDCPVPGTPASGAIRLLPNSGGSNLKISNIGSSGQDGVRLSFVPPPVLNSFFDVFYNTTNGTETILHGDPDFDLMVTRTYDKATPKLLEKVSSGSIGLDSFFDVFYDLSLASHGVGFGNNPDNLCMVTTYDKATPKLLERVSSGSIGLDSFFDVFYDLSLAKHGIGFGNNPNDLCMVTTFDKATPKLLERVSSNSVGLDSFFDVFYDLSLASHGVGFGNNPDNLCMVTTYDKATPKLLERVSSGSIGLDSFFDVFYDLSLAKHGIGFGNNPNDLCMVTTFDKATPKLLERVSSNSIGLDSFFDVFYDLSLASHGVGFGNNPDNLCMVTTYDKATPKLLERVSSGSIGLDSFFDVFYDLSLASYGVGFGNNPDNLCLVTMYDPLTPKLTQKISTGLPAANGFFDISYDLELGRETHRFGIVPEDPDFDLIVVREWDKSTPKLKETISSADPDLNNSFFDITYNLDLGTLKTEHNHNAYTVTASEPATICWKLESMLPGTPDFFDICYDMELGRMKTEYNNLKYSQTFIDASKSEVTIESNLPAVQGFFDITYDIGLTDIQSHSTRAGLLGAPPMEMRYEYDALSRKIRQVGFDTQNGSTLSLEWLLGPTGSSLLVSDKLQVQGSLSTPGSGPLVLEDNLMVVGTSHQINGMLAVNGPTHQISGMVTVNGNLHVNGTLTATNKMFKIDHPLDPENKYLVHSCIESPDMMNIYNGNAITNDHGYVTIKLPDYFEALNADFRYQLTCIGQFAQAIVEQKIIDNQFVIRTDKPNVEVSWQVTGIRHDPAAMQQQFQVEDRKDSVRSKTVTGNISR